MNATGSGPASTGAAPERRRPVCVAAKDPVTARQLQSLLRTWRQLVNAQMQQANPAYDPARVNEWYSRATVEPTRAPGAPRAEGEGGRGKGKGKKRAAE